MNGLFDPFAIARLTLKNRIVRSATWEGMADADGFVTDKLVELYAALARGGTGLIMTGYAYVQPDGKGLPGQTGIFKDEHIEGLARIAETVHANGGLCFAQIVHAGGQTNTKTTGRDVLVAPSPVSYPGADVIPRAFETDELPALAAAFAIAAWRAQQAGFDGVQLHGAHGYLINRFLSPNTNLREDVYGGDLEGRARFGREVIEAVRRQVGDDYPISMKINSEDCEDGGLELADAIEAAKIFEAAGLDHLEISGGTPGAGKLGAVRKAIDSLDKEAYFRANAREMKAALTIPTTVVGGIRSFSTANDIVATGDADSVALARPLICEPDLPNQWRRGDEKTAKCISDGGCFVAGLKQGGIRCTAFEKKAE